jgi:hypothetical protein
MSKYNNIPVSQSTLLDVELKRRYFVSIIDPQIPKQSDDIYVVCSFGERLDLLAWKYYQNVEYWWIIAAANPELRKDSLNLETGVQIRIPKDFQNVLTLIANQLNSR